MRKKNLSTNPNCHAQVLEGLTLLGPNNVEVSDPKQMEKLMTDDTKYCLSLQSATKKEITGRRRSIYLRDVNARNPVVERLKENVRRIVAASTEVVSLVTGFQVGVCVVANENLLVCIGDSLSEEQIAHIDFDDRQYQAVVFLTSRTPSTLVDKCACQRTFTLQVRALDADSQPQPLEEPGVCHSPYGCKGPVQLQLL